MLRKQIWGLLNVLLIFGALLPVSIRPVMAQETTLVQVKTFDLNLKPLPNLRISFDEVYYFSSGPDATVFVDIDNSLLPPKVIYFEDLGLEAESWNYSKGVLEIIVREKTYEFYRLSFVDADGQPLRNISFKLNTDIPLGGTTNAAGIVKLAVPVTLSLHNPDMFIINGYNVTKTDFSGTSGRITASIVPVVTEKPKVVTDDANLIAFFDVSQLDSIKSLPVFYAFLKQLDLTAQSISQQELLDAKFEQLLLTRSDSLIAYKTGTAEISDSTLLTNDIVFLTERALQEGRAISNTRKDFNQQLEIINDKIAEGGGNLSDDEREKLLTEINNLDALIKANEVVFSRNQTYYKSALSQLKDKLLNIQELEKQLSEAEMQRLAEQKQSRQKLLITFGIIVGLILILILFVFLIRKVLKQKNALSIAHQEAKEINDNLEYLVNKRTRALQRVNKELDTFLYRSSHDLKRPLSSIIGLANIAKITLDKDANDLFDKTRETADSMDKLLQKLITISQINYPEEYSKIDFIALMKKINQQFKDTIDKKGTDLTYKVADNIEFTSEPRLIECIFINLIDNALFYSSFNSRRKPKVEVSVYVEELFLYIDIKDNGGGISDKIESKIWNMFYRGHESSTGNGLGLYITKRAVKVINGSVTYETKSGEYTVFHVKIPLPDDVQEQEDRNPTASDRLDIELA